MSEEKLMVISRLVKASEQDQRTWDYCACVTPNGFTQTDSLRFFNQEDIEQLVFIGYQDDLELRYAVALRDFRDKSLQAKE
jgi:hypothetical protein